MSVGYGVYLVSRDEVLSLPGSHDWHLLDAILREMAEQIIRDDEELDAEEWGFGVAEALREIIDGKRTRTHDHEHFYAWAFELACRYFGSWLGDQIGHGNWFDRLDETLKQAGIAIRFADLAGRSPFPPSAKMDFIGSWDEREIAQIPALTRLLETIEDAQQADVFEASLSWLEQAEDQPGSIVVGFYG